MEKLLRLQMRILVVVPTLPLTSYAPMDGASLVAHLVKNLHAMWETWIRSLGGEDPLEKGKTTHSSILVWRSPWIMIKIYHL